MLEEDGPVDDDLHDPVHVEEGVRQDIHHELEEQVDQEQEVQQEHEQEQVLQGPLVGEEAKVDEEGEQMDEPPEVGGRTQLLLATSWPEDPLGRAKSQN